MLFRLCLAAVCLATTATAQSIEDAGPFPVGFRDRTFSHAFALTDPVTARFYYPALTSGLGATADPSGGPFPVVALVHGSGTFPFDYDLLCNHIASWGFVVGSVGTIGSFTTTIPADMQGMLHWIDEESEVPGSFLFDMASDDPWSAIGHSSGAISLFHLADLESQVETMLALEPSWNGVTDVDNFTGELLVVGATDDVVTPPATHALNYFDDSTSAPRRLYLEVQGGGHNGVLDIPFGVPPTLSDAEQHRVHRRVVTGFLRAERFGESELYQDILGAGIATDPLIAVSKSGEDPPHWVTESSTTPGKLAWGFAREPGDFAVWMAAAGTVAVPTDYGIFGLDPLTMIIVLANFTGPSGVAELTANVNPALSGFTFYFQGLAAGISDAKLTETLSFTFP